MWGGLPMSAGFSSLSPSTLIPPPFLSPTCRVFAKAAEYATKFGGIVEASEFALVDEVYAQLSSMQFQRPGEAEGTVTNISIHQYEMVALANLNPASVAAARSVIPSLERFADAEIEEMLALLRRASAKYSAGAAGGMAGAEGAGMGSSQGMAGMASAAGFGGF